MAFKNMLSVGAIESILNNENIQDPVFQVVSIKALFFDNDENDNTKKQYRLHIYDGQKTYFFVIMEQQLNNVIFSGHVTQFSIVQFKDYRIVEEGNKILKFIIVETLDVLVNGDSVNSFIGQPEELYSNFSNLKHQMGRNILPNILSNNFVDSIENDIKVDSAYVQIIHIKDICNTVAFAKHWGIFDGQNMYPFVVVENNLDCMLSQDEVSLYSIIEIKEYKILGTSLKYSKKVISLKDFVLFIPGVLVGALTDDSIQFDKPTSSTGNAISASQSFDFNDLELDLQNLKLN